MTTTVSNSLNKLQTFKTDDVKDESRLVERLNDMVTVLRSTQEARQVFVKAPNIVPNAQNEWTVVFPPLGFTIGGVVLTAFRITNLQQRTPTYQWGVDFMTLPNGGIKITGKSGDAVVAGAAYTASFMLLEDS